MEFIFNIKNDRVTRYVYNAKGSFYKQHQQPNKATVLWIF